jgi:starch-binding outer membrane protein, SusD/RagB family
MKTNYFNALKITVACCLLLLLGSCKKYLDQQPITDVSTQVVFKDVPSTYKALAGAYSRLVGDAGFGIRLSLYYTVDNDEMQGPTGAADNDRRDIARFSTTPGNAQITNPFNQLFQGIEFANICIDNIPAMELYKNGTENEKKQLRRMYGEALTLRAQYYLEAIMNWGDLPANFTSAYNVAGSNPFPSRTDRDTLYNHLLADLKIAEDLVPWRNEVTSIGDVSDERITKGAVKGLRARIALFRGGYSLRSDATMKRGADYLTYYQIARDECNDIMTSTQHSLNPSFKALWKDQVNGHAVNDPNGELMFQASAIGLTGAEDTKLGYYNGPTVNGLGNKSVNVLPTYFYLFDSTDLRRDVTCAAYNVAANGSTKIGQAITAICDGKYRRDWITNPIIAPTNAVQYLGLKWQILRYSDVLLMFAEAENEINGPTTAAYNAINQVRRRGYGKPIGTVDAIVDLPSGLSKASFFAAIVKERALELGGEGVRKYDLIRWNLLATALNETKANLLKMSTSTVMANPSYMANYPVYSLSTALPISMYYITVSTSDDNNIGGIWNNSLYKTAPAATPSGTTKVVWLSAAINTTALSRYATGFVTGKGELMPIPQPARDANINLSQNPGY